MLNLEAGTDVGVCYPFMRMRLLSIEFQIISIILIIVLTRAVPTLQYHFLLFFFFLGVGLVFYSFVIFLLCCYGIVAKYFGFSIFGSKYYKCIKCSFGNYLRSFFFCSVV